MKVNNKTTAFAALAVVAMMMGAFIPLMFEPSDATEPETQTFYRYTINSKIALDDPNASFADIQYIVWDFGDGTVLDGRWQYYIDKELEGETLPAEIKTKTDEYKELLEEHGGQTAQVVHTYAQIGQYTVTCAYMNPVGFLYTDTSSGMEVIYDGEMYSDKRTYDGGLMDNISKDITTPSDEDLQSSAFKEVAGSWQRCTIIHDIRGYPTITFNTNGGSAVEDMIVENDHEYKPATAPEAPTKTGYSFNGWYTDQELTNPYDWASLVRHDMTLYAGWTVIEYTHTIHYSAGEGTGTMADTVVTNTITGNTAVTLAQCTFQLTDKQFAGWKIGNQIYSAGQTVNIPGNESITAVAQWEDANIIITINGQEVSMPNGSHVSDLAKPTKEGYDFEGWYSTSEFTTKLADDTLLVAGMDIYAKMTEKSDKSFFEDNMWAIIILVVGIIVAIAGFFIHPVAIIIGAIIAAIGALGIFDVIQF